MEYAITETKRRRDIQNQYNIEHNITPTTITKSIPKSITMKSADEIADTNKEYHKNMTKEEKIQKIMELEEEMKAYAKELNFEAAALIRDAIFELKASK